MPGQPGPAVGRPGRELVPHIDVFTALQEARRGWPGQVFSPGTSPTGVRGHSRHVIIAWIRSKGGEAMPWRERSVVDERREFVELAMQEGANRRELCRRFGIHPTTGYKWLGRFAAEGELADRSRRPHTSPLQTEAAVEQAVLAVRDAHPAWGARKIVRCLEREHINAPARSTVHDILQRSGRIAPAPGAPGAFQRFEKPAPNR